MSWRVWMGIGVGLSSIAASGCSEERTDEGGGGDLGTEQQASSHTLNTFIDDSLEIDELSGGPGDANLFVGLDPADDTASAQLPTGGPATWIDWDDLGGDLANHQLLDLDGPGGKDPTAFPLSNECVGSAQVLSKMDLTYVGAANNQAYAYFAVQRSANNGDAAYYWLLTQKAPELIAGGGPCSADKSQLIYDITGPTGGGSGDVLLQGHFHPSSEVPLLRVFQANSDANDLTAVQAIDFTSGIWTEATGAVAAAAVNTTITAPGALGAAGVKSLSGGNVQAEIFAEAAVDLDIFTSGALCGASFYGTVITRSSGSGGVTPDLKDLAGPALFNFGEPSAVATLTPTCGQAVDFAVTDVIDFAGNPATPTSCLWDFGGGVTNSNCSGTQNLAVGSHGATVTVNVGGCEIVQTAAAVDVCAELDVTAALDGGCAGSFDYDANPTGGCGGVTYAWTFSGPGSVTPGSSTSENGSVSVGAAGTYTGNVTVTDTRTDLPGLCTANASDSDPVYEAIVATIDATAGGDGCVDDAVTWTASAQNGLPPYTYEWLGAGALAGCTGATCTINPADDLFCTGPLSISVRIDDAAADCLADESETETYTKLTTVTIGASP